MTAERGREGAAREEPHARPGLAAAGRPQGQDRLADPGRQGDRQGRHAGRHLLSRSGRRREQEEERGQEEGQEKAAAARAPAARGGGGEGAADIVVPAIAKDDTLDAYAKKLGDLGIVPVVVQAVQRRQAGHAVRRPIRPAAPRWPTARRCKVLVSVGQPQVLYTNGKDILRLNGATAAKLDPVATEPRRRAGPDLGRRRRARRLHRRRPRDAQGPHEEELGAGAADAGRRRASRTSRGRRPPTST